MPSTLFNNTVRKIAFNHLNHKQINTIRKVKWSILKPFINDMKSIEHFYDSEYEIRILDKLLPIIIEKDEPVILDIGANIGGYSYYLSKYIYSKKGKCIGFEPRTDTFNRLTKNVSLDNFYGEKIALSNKSGSADLSLHTSPGRSSLIDSPEFDGFGKEKVSICSLDTYVSSKKLKDIVFMKVDVEGHELDVLEGGSETIRENLPIILCESENKHLLIQNRSVKDVIALMASIEYESYVISKTKNQILNISNSQLYDAICGGSEYFYNFWFIPKRKAERYLPLYQKVIKTL